MYVRRRNVTLPHYNRIEVQFRRDGAFAPRAQSDRRLPQRDAGGEGGGHTNTGEFR